MRHVACMEHRSEAQLRDGQTDKQKEALKLGRQKGTNHLEGNKHSEETKRKMSESAKKWCAENPEQATARAINNRGENHYKWNGGSSQLNTSIRRMTEYRKWADAVVRRDGVCMKCGIDTDLEAHHSKSLANIIIVHDITTIEQARNCTDLWNVNNGTTLCERCHCECHGREYTPIGFGRRKEPRRVRRSMAGENNPNYHGGKVCIICPVCGQEFYAKPSRVHRRKTCSRRCANENQRKHI